MLMWVEASRVAGRTELKESLEPLAKAIARFGERHFMAAGEACPLPNHKLLPEPSYSLEKEVPPMGKRNRPKRQKKRKVKRARRAPKRVSLAYHGNKYKKEELVRTLMRAEVGIYESFVMTDRQLTDHTVEAAVEELVLRMRRGALPELEDTASVDIGERGEAGLVIWNIRRNWCHLFETEPPPSRENQIGILRTILGSIDVWKSVSPTSRGYLRYLEGFLQKLGVTVEAYSSDGTPFQETEDDDLLSIGRDWCGNDDPEAAAAFRNLAEYMIRSGDEERVVDVCQQLIGESPASEAFPELAEFSIRAQEWLRSSMG